MKELTSKVAGRERVNKDVYGRVAVHENDANDFDESELSQIIAAVFVVFYFFLETGQSQEENDWQCEYYKDEIVSGQENGHIASLGARVACNGRGGFARFVHHGEFGFDFALCGCGFGGASLLLEFDCVVLLTCALGD